MTLPLPWEFSQFDPAGKELEDRLQDVFDEVAKQFPVGLQNVAQVPQARVYNSAALAINNATPTAVTFNSEHWDTASLHSIAANTSRLTANVAGLWIVSASIVWAFNAAGFRQLYLQHQGATVFAADLAHADAAAGNQQTVTSPYRLAAGEYVEAFVQQTSGGALNVVSSANFTPEFSMHWVSP